MIVKIEKSLLQFLFGAILIGMVSWLSPYLVNWLSQNEVILFVVEEEIDTSTLFYTECEYFK